MTDNLFDKSNHGKKIKTLKNNRFFRGICNCCSIDNITVNNFLLEEMELIASYLRRKICSSKNK
jgi:hypothetical protein